MKHLQTEIRRRNDWQTNSMAEQHVVRKAGGLRGRDLAYHTFFLFFFFFFSPRCCLFASGSFHVSIAFTLVSQQYFFLLLCFIFCFVVLLLLCFGLVL